MTAALTAMTQDRLLSPFQRLVDFFTRRIDYLATYPCKVVTQPNPGLLDVQPEDSRLPGMQGVPCKFGIPGTTATFEAGARVYLTFEAGNPSAPIISGYDPLVAGVSGIAFFNGTLAIARATDAIDFSNFTVTAPSGTTGGPCKLTGTVTIAANAGNPNVKA